MITAILDTNVLVRALLTSKSTAASRTIDALHDGRYQLIYSSELLDEWIEVLTVPHIRARHGLTDDELLEFLASLLVNAAAYLGQVPIPASLPRDPTDVKFLALADESSADYLVTRDYRHLLRLGRFGRTQIVTPAQFLRHLP